MSAIATLTEDYAGAAAGVAISTSNTIYDAITGTPTSNAFHASGPAGGNGKSQRIVTGGDFSINVADITPVTVLYTSFYFYVEALPLVNQSILVWFSGATRVGDVRVLTDGTLQLRDNINSRWVSTAPLALGAWHRIDAKCDPGQTDGLLVNIWSGGNLHGSATPTETSGPRSSTASGLLPTDTVSEIRVGASSNDAATIVRISRLRGDNAAFPAQLSTGNTPPVANAGPDQTTVAAGATVTLTGAASTDPDGTIASYAWTQVSGPTVTLSGSGATRTFTAPPTFANTMVFQLTVTDNLGVTGTDTVTITTLAANTAISALIEDFAGAAAGVFIATTNTIYDTITGSATSNAFNASGPTGGNNKSQRIVAGGGNSINNADFTPVDALYFSFYLYIEAASATNEAIASWWSGATKVGDLRILPDNTIQIRDNATGRWTSTALATGVWHRIEVKCDPGLVDGHLVNVWSGGRLNETTSPSQTSGPQSSTLAGVVSTATMSQLRMGLISNDASAIVRFARLRGDSTIIPPPISSTNTPPVANAGSDQTGVDAGDTVTLSGSASTDSDGSIVSYVWTQVSGAPTVALSGTGATRTFVAPGVGVSTTLSFQLMVTDDAGATATDTVTVQIDSSTVVANAGPDQVDIVPFNTVTITGAGSVGATSYAWTQTAGPTVTLAGSGAARTFAAPATINGADLTFQLVATGAGAITATDSMTVHVLNWNRFRIASDGSTRTPIKHNRVN